MKITPEIARIHAHICGDGYVCKSLERRSPADLASHSRINKKRMMWTLAYCNTSENLIYGFQQDLRKIFNRNGCYEEQNT